ncbi:MAG: hypothetical protein R6V12_08795, partial [Candidatus Hydrogenedentota bacterium]
PGCPVFNHIRAAEAIKGKSPFIKPAPRTASPLSPSRHLCESRGPVCVPLPNDARPKRPLGWTAFAQRTKVILHRACRKPPGFLPAQE